MSPVIRRLAAVFTLLALSLPGPLLAARIALVIGNDDYNRFGDLANAGNDARAIARVLRNDLDFELIGGSAQTNIDSQRARQLIKQFGERLGRDDVAFFYFAGHGIGAGQTNFLIPVDDKEIIYFEDVPDFAIDAQSVLRRMEQRGEGVNIMILDACRDQGLSQRTRSGEMRGLSRMNPPAGSFIGYAASPGQKAADGKGSNGVFTEQFVRLMITPGYTLDDVFTDLTDSVKTATAGKQTPIRESNLNNRFMLVPPIGVYPGLPSTPVFDAVAAERAYWEAVDRASVDALLGYIGRYPKGQFAKEARRALAGLTRLAAAPVATPSTAASGTFSKLVSANSELELRTAHASWIRIEDSNGKVLLSGTIPAGAHKTLRGTPPYSLFLGYAPGTTIEFAGSVVDLTPHTRQNSTARLTLPTVSSIAPSDPNRVR